SSRSTYRIRATSAPAGIWSCATASSKRSGWLTRYEPAYLMTRRWELAFWPILALAVLLGVWHVSVVWSHTRVFPSPLDVGRGLVELMGKGLLWNYIRDSLFRVALGYLLA